MIGEYNIVADIIWIHLILIDNEKFYINSFGLSVSSFVNCLCCLPIFPLKDLFSSYGFIRLFNGTNFSLSYLCILSFPLLYGFVIKSFPPCFNALFFFSRFGVCLERFFQSKIIFDYIFFQFFDYIFIHLTVSLLLDILWWIISNFFLKQLTKYLWIIY